MEPNVDIIQDKLLNKETHEVPAVGDEQPTIEGESKSEQELRLEAENEDSSMHAAPSQVALSPR